MRIEKAKRIEQIPPYLFAEIDKKKEEMRKKGMDLIDLGIGDPDLSTPAPIIERMKKAAEDPGNHHYPSYEGMFQFRQAASNWFEKRFHISFDPKTEVLALIGSKEGIAHIPLAFVNPGDYVLVPSPGYPVYRVSTLFAGGTPYFMPLLKENGFLPRLSDIPKDVAEKSKLLFINYPNNPTAAIAERPFFEEVIAFARRYGIIVCHDAAYSELAFDGYRPLSFFEIEGAKEVGIEFHSLSKTFNMTGWRVGFAVGNPEIVSGLGRVKTNIDSGVFQAIQEAGIEALNRYDTPIPNLIRIYEGRRDVMVKGLRELGLEVDLPKATFYLWIRVPRGYTSAQFATLLIENAGIVATPGNGFGDAGEGYIRMTLTVDESKLQEAINRLKKINF
ncbi:MAG: LL-diaminopimelate aminotransferase [Deltaproteobacteria bacterium]|nr:LL-diaminopimelate aminotransferase [Deltaproteobacteria bacterium]MBM4323746.1 LL-diaminopimelate aminotransferase [Deltaproteobacteria bacterium]